jgi:hypothetical protein
VVPAVRRLPVPVLAASAALLLAACGGGGSAKAGSATSSTTTPGGRFRNAAFTSCLKQHGVTRPAGAYGGRRPRGGSGASGASGASGSSGAGGSGRRGFGFGGGGPGISVPGVSAQKVQAAFSACRSDLPNGGRFGGGGGFGADAGAVKAYLSCLSDHGVKVPTTTSGSTPAGTGSALRTVRNDPKFAAANKTCQALLPARGAATTTTTPS